MVSIQSTLMAIALSMVANGYAIPSVKDMGLDKRGSGVFLLDFRVVEGPARNLTVTGVSKRDLTEAALYPTGLGYDIDLLVGSEKDPVVVTIDTGSSDLWVVAKTANCTSNAQPPRNCTAGGTFDQTKSSTWKTKGEIFGTIYGDHTIAIGVFGNDSVGFPNGPTIPELEFGLAAIDTAGTGILGIGPVTTEADHIFLGYPIYPNFPQALKNEGFINKVAYSLYLNEKGAKSGMIVFGGYDSDKFYGSLVKLPLVSDLIMQVSLESTTTAGGNKTVLNVPATLDSGTTYTYLPQAVVDAVAIELAQNTTSGTPSCDQPDKLLSFNFDGITIGVPYSELIGPALNLTTGVPLGYCLEGVIPFDSSTGVILGDTFLRSAYVLYDLEDKTASLAPVKYTDSSNLVAL